MLSLETLGTYIPDHEAYLRNRLIEKIREQLVDEADHNQFKIEVETLNALNPEANLGKIAVMIKGFQDKIAELTELNSGLELMSTEDLELLCEQNENKIEANKRELKQKIEGSDIEPADPRILKIIEEMESNSSKDFASILNSPININLAKSGAGKSLIDASRDGRTGEAVSASPIG
jgi:hypothetical protein